MLLNPERSVNGPHHREMNETFDSTTVKAVCGPCNNGFMNDIESEARPYLSAMIPRQVSDVAQRRGCDRNAAWAVKTSLAAVRQ